MNKLLIIILILSIVLLFINLIISFGIDCIDLKNDSSNISLNFFAITLKLIYL
jgi:hypothetical protein